MRVTILTVGSRGDVEPCVALGLGLRAAGCEVRIASDPTFETLIRDRGFPFSPLSVDPRAVVESLARARNSARGIMRGFREVLEPKLYKATDESIKAAEDADALLVSSAAFLGYDVAEARGLPTIGLSLAPLMSPTSYFPNALMPARIGISDSVVGRSLGSVYNRLSHSVAEQLLWQPFRRTVNRIRSELLSLPPRPFLGPVRESQMTSELQLYSWSNELLPQPPDWAEQRHVTGYWFLEREEGWEPPPALARFLDEGRPPVCMGFGSSHLDNAPHIAQVFTNTLASMGQRGILLGGWGGLKGESLPRHIFEIDEAPYDWLLPRTRGFVHHGSTGATHSALKAKVPSVTVPYYGDQPLWGYLLARAGVAPDPVHRRRLSGERLAKAVSAIIVNPHISSRAASLGEKVERENGVEKAVQLILQSLSHAQS